MVSQHESSRRFSRSPTRVRQSCNLRNPRSHRLDRIMRLILIDNYSGNFDIRACLTEAARMIDADNGEYGRTYTGRLSCRCPG